MSEKLFTINSRKADGSLHKTWQAEYLEENSEYWLFVGEFAETIKHNKLGIIRRGTISYEYYWKNRWYNVFRFHNPIGDFRNFYCNLNLPPAVSGNVLDYVDLDIDILVRKDMSFEILDLDEYKINSKIFNYSAELMTEVEKNLNELINCIQNKEFPFDFV